MKGDDAVAETDKERQNREAYEEVNRRREQERQERIDREVRERILARQRKQEEGR